MKKILSLIIAGILLHFSLVSAQTIKQSEVIIPKLNKLYLTPHMDQCIEGAGSNHYVYNTGFNYSYSKKSTTDCLITLAKDDFSCHKTLVAHHPDYEFIHAFETNDGVIAFYRMNDKNSKAYKIYANLISKDDNTGAFDPEEILSLPNEKKDNLAIAYAESPDKKQHVIAFFQSQRKGASKGNVIMTFDENGKNLWKQDMAFGNFSQEYLQLIDVAINNEGKVFTGVYVFDAPSNTSRKNNAFLMYEITDNNITNTYQDIECNISNGKMAVGKNGNIYVGGYYYKDLKKNENGSFIYTYVASTSSFSALAQQDFPADYQEKFTGTVMLGYYPNQTYSAIPRAIYEFDNGSVALLGEQRYVLSIQDLQTHMTTYHFFAKNILLSQTDPYGQFGNFDLFPRAAHGAWGFPGNMFESLNTSYIPYFKDNHIYISYSDNVNNYAGKSGAAFKLAKDYCGTWMTIDENGKSSRQKLITFKTDKYMINQPLFLDEDGLYIITKDNKSMSVAKMDLD